MERKLTTIFASDVVGFSKMMGTDEVNTLKQEVLNLNADRERSKFSKIDEETNQPVTVEIEPTQTFQNDKFQQCREYNYAYTKNGETSHGRGYACLNEQGIWQELHHENG